MLVNINCRNVKEPEWMDGSHFRSRPLSSRPLQKLPANAMRDNGGGSGKRTCHSLCFFPAKLAQKNHPGSLSKSPGLKLLEEF
jgi:hypothetical protein